MPELILKIIYGSTEKNQVSRNDTWMRQDKAWALSQAIGMMIHDGMEAGIIDLRRDVLAPEPCKRQEIAALRLVP